MDHERTPYNDIVPAVDAALAAQSAPFAHPAHRDVVTTGTLESHRAYTLFALGVLVDRADGWLRVVPERDGNSVFIKWKFTHGLWDGHYVLAVTTRFSIAAGFATLLEKLEDVDRGRRRPTKDHYHKGG